MATFDEVDALFLKPMSALFRCPRDIRDPEAAKVEIARWLMDFDCETLKRAWIWIRETYAGPNWPTAPDIRRALSESASDLLHPSCSNAKWRSKQELARRDLALRMLAETPVGQMAKQEGIASIFVDTVTELGRVPTFEELEGIRSIRARTRSWRPTHPNSTGVGDIVTKGLAAVQRAILARDSAPEDAEV